MSYFLTANDIKSGKKCLLKGRIVTPIDMGGRSVKLAEDGKWHLHESLRPLTEDQIRDEVVETMAAFVAGKSISTLKAKGGGVEFVMSDNTRVGLTITSADSLKLSVTDSDGKRIL
jgi:hypothetical protein